MKNYLYLILLIFIFISNCAKHNPINFSSSDAFFSSLNKKDIIEKENKTGTLEKSNLKKDNFKKNGKEKVKKENKTGTLEINNLKKDNFVKENIKKSFLLTLSSYEKQLKAKIGSDEIKIIKVFNEPDLTIKHGKVKNIQFHFQFCHLDLFFLKKDKTYIFKHFDIRPSSISSNLNKNKCVKELNSKFILIHDPN